MTTPTVGVTWQMWWSEKKNPLEAMHDLLDDFRAVYHSQPRVVLCQKSRIVQMLGVEIREPDPTCEPIPSGPHIYFVREEALPARHNQK